jgi:hypothetical protein
MTLLERTETGVSDAVSDHSHSLNQGGDVDDSVHNGNGSTPLFFAIEKQNELNTARDEINRLAGDAESENHEAYDATDEMRQKMEKANARLLRCEKLGTKSTRQLSVPPSSYAPYRSTGFVGLYPGSRGDGIPTSPGNDSVINLEYLKNFLKAEMLADRRKLVPVLSTVVCLTLEEQSDAVLSAEQASKLTGVLLGVLEM